MRNSLYRTIALALVLAAAPFAVRVPSLAQNNPPPAQSEQSDFSLEGKITKQEAGKLTVSAGENIIFHVTYDEKTEIKRKDGTAGSAKDLQKGAKINVTGKLSETGEIVSRRIELE